MYVLMYVSSMYTSIFYLFSAICKVIKALRLLIAEVIKQFQKDLLLKYYHKNPYYRHHQQHQQQQHCHHKNQ